MSRYIAISRHVRKTMQVILVCTMLLIALPISSTEANSAAPPPALVLQFEYHTSHKVSLYGLQVIECDDETCSSGVLVQQFGTCTSAECMKTDPVWEDWQQDIVCANWKCTFAIPDGYDTTIQLIFEFSDHARISAPLGSLPKGRGDFDAKTVIVSDTEIQVQPNPNYRATSKLSRLITMFPFSLGVELFLSFVYFKYRMKLISIEQRKFLFVVFLSNLITYPVVWRLLPYLSDLYEDFTLPIGVILACIIFTFVFVLIQKLNPSVQKNIAMIVIIIASPYLCAMTESAFIALTPLQNPIAPVYTVIIAEIFAVVVETMLIWLFANRKIALRYAVELSLLANVASCSLGFLIFPLH